MRYGKIGPGLWAFAFSFTLLGPVAVAQEGDVNVVGTYVPKERGGKECLRINADGTFGRYLPCTSAKPDIAGTWSIVTDRDGDVVVALDSPELKEQGCGPDEDECQLLPGKQLGRRFLIWNAYTYWEKKD